MVKIRLQRQGRKKLPIYKIVATDSRVKRDGRFIESLGQYKPLDHPATVTLDEERVLYWLKVGAKPSDTVRSLLSREGMMLRFHLMRKGKSEEEIQKELEAWKAVRDARNVRSASKKQLRAQRKKQAEAASTAVPEQTAAKADAAASEASE